MATTPRRTNLSIIQLLAAATATNGPPSGAGAGFELPDWDDAILLAKSTAGSGTMTWTGRLWCFKRAGIDDWFPLGTHATAATKGVINQGNAIGETGTDTIHHAELVSGLKAFDRVYLEITAIGGTSTAMSAWLARAKREYR